LARRLEFPLRGAGGEPVDLWRTLNSHGFVDLPPMRLDEQTRTLEITVPIAGARPRTVRIADGGEGRGTVTVLGPEPGDRAAGRVLAGIERVLRLDADLSGFYRLAREDQDLSWVTVGAGRMVRSPTVFEDVAKTICTTNCTWAATKRMVAALVEHLGSPAAGRPSGGPSDGPYGRAFPTPRAMAEAGEDFYRDVARAGYRGPYLHSLARSVAEGDLDLEILGRATPEDLLDAEIERRLLALPGIGPYAAAHVMLTLGRYSKLILDSWTRPAYAKHVGRKAVSDAAMQRRFKRYGPYAGLAFWLILTRDWV
jgi:3-methyladenine DNA glycosylase/8-oxoguanine DNA glycosylase